MVNLYGGDADYLITRRMQENHLVRGGQEMKLRIVKKAIKECLIKGRKSPLGKKVRLDDISDFMYLRDKKNIRYDA